MEMAALGEAAHHRDEHVIRLHADRLLRRQWKAIASVEGPSSRLVLAVTSGRRAAAHHSGAAVAPFGAVISLLNPCVSVISSLNPTFQ